MKNPPLSPASSNHSIEKIFFFINAGIVFILACLLMAHIQFNPNNPYLPEFDSYYHVKMAEIMKEQGILKEFPWLYFTILRDAFVNHQLLFHILLVPFITVFGTITGAKIFEVMIVALCFVMVYVILKKQNVKYALFLALFALFTMSSDFYYRMNFIRDMGLSLFFILTGVYAVLQNKKILLGILSFLYVWAYGGFLFLPIFALCFFVAQVLTDGKGDIKLCLSSWGGMLLGMIINPYFPESFSFLFAQIFQTGLGAQEYTGGEWRPYDTWFWFQINLIPVLLFLTSIVIVFIKNLKQNAFSIAFFVFTLFFLVLQWKSKRFVEYSSLFLTFSAFLLLKPFLQSKWEEWRSTETSFFSPLKIKENVIYVGAFCVLMIFSWSFAFGKFDGEYVFKGQIDRAYRDTETLFSMSALKKAHAYLLENANQGDIVFTDDWDVFPRYFFANHKTYYIVGLDPEFMNQYEGEPYVGQKGALYQEFANISSGSDSSNLERIKENFKASWVMINVDHGQFYQNLKNRPDLFEEVLFAGNDPSVDRYPQAQGDGYYLFKVL